MGYLLCILLLASQVAFGQATISGRLVDDQNKPIANVSVSYKKVGQALIRICQNG